MALLFNLLILIEFQCQHEPIVKGDETLHIIGHYCHKNPNKICEYMHAFIENHQDWISQVGGKFVHRKGANISDYLYKLTTPKVPIDKLGIMIIACMYHKRIGVMLQDTFWTTNAEQKLNKCYTVPRFMGKLNFCDTKPLPIRILDLPISELDLLKPKQSVKVEKNKEIETVAADVSSEAASAPDGITPIVIQPIVSPPAAALSDGHDSDTDALIGATGGTDNKLNLNPVVVITPLKAQIEKERSDNPDNSSSSKEPEP